MKLQLGVIDMPHPEGGTTYSVAQNLEKTYKVFSVFADKNAQFMADAIVGDISNRFTARLRKERTGKAFAAANDQITDRFKQFISNSEMEKLGIRGVPTKAALDGTTLRTKNNRTIRKHTEGNKYLRVKGIRRPSFIYSGLFQSNLKCWVED